MPSFTGTVEQLSTPIELIAHGVPLWIIVKVFGHDEMFDERMESFREWFESKEREWSKPVKEMTAKLFKGSDQYRESLNHPGCDRTSNQVDRLINRMTRLMYSGRGIHGNHDASELRLRSCLSEMERPSIEHASASLRLAFA